MHNVPHTQIDAAMRIVNCLWDIRPILISPRISMRSLIDIIYEEFENTYSDIREYNIFVYTDRRLIYGTYNVMVKSPHEVYNGALLTLVPVHPTPRRIPKDTYYNRVDYMTHSRSRFVQENQLRERGLSQN